MEVKAKKVKEQHLEQVKRLKHCIWERDETARVMLTNVDVALKVFLETVVRVAGTSREYNTNIATTNCVQVLLSLLDCAEPTIRRLTIEGVSKCAWNGHKDFRWVWMNNK